MATPPSWTAEKPDSAPDIFPIGVRAPATRYEPGMSAPPARVTLKVYATPGQPHLPTGSLRAMEAILEAIDQGAGGEEIAALPIPDHYRAAYVRRDETAMFEGIESAEKDPRKSLHVGDVPTPEIAPDEVYVAVMASSINFNTVWTSIFEPVSTFGPLARLGRESEWAKRHDRDYQVVGSDASGVVLRVGSATRNRQPGDRAAGPCNHVDDKDPSAHDASMMATNQRIWGYETNFGGLADL